MKNKLLIIPGYLVGIGSLFIITYRTLLAFLNNSKSVTVFFYRYCEQWIDLIFLAFIWIVCLMGLYFLFRYLKEDSIQRFNDLSGKKVINKDGEYLGIFYNSLVDEKTGIINKLLVKPSESIDTNLYKVDSDGNMVFTSDSFDITKNQIVIK